MSLISYPKTSNIYRRSPDTHKMLPGQFQLAANAAITKWQAHEKVDGMNARIDFRVSGKNGIDGSDAVTASFAGRTDAANLSGTQADVLRSIAWDETVRDYAYINLLSHGLTSLTLFGELVGPKIQGNPYKLERPEFILFDVLADDRTWLPQDVVTTYAEDLYLRRAQPLGWHTVESAIELVNDGLSSSVPLLGTEAQAEGVILRPAVELTDSAGRRIMAKVKHCDFGGEEWKAETTTLFGGGGNTLRKFSSYPYRTDYLDEGLRDCA